MCEEATSQWNFGQIGRQGSHFDGNHHYKYKSLAGEPVEMEMTDKVVDLMPEPFVEAKAAAEFLHYSVGSIKQMARDGRIPAHPFGSGPRKRWYFLISELAEHLHAQVNSAHGEAGRDKAQRRVF
jgi:hypothetical protein